jgi:hypothetical protein
MIHTEAPTDWAALLDDIEDGLDTFPPVLVDALPTNPGPIPSALVARATRTLERMTEAEAALEHHRTDLARDLTAISAVKSAATATPSIPRFLDTRA